MKLSFFLPLAALSGLVSSVATNLNKRDTPLTLTLEMVDNTKVKATLTNTGSTALKVLSMGSFLDTAPVEKAQVYTAGMSFLYEVL